MKTRIKEYRTKQKMKQIELAESVGVSRETIVRIENGHCNPSLKLAINIANVLGATIDQLFYTDDGEP